MTNDIDISPEAVEHLCAIHEGYEQHGTVATLRALSAALDQSQGLVDRWINTSSEQDQTIYELREALTKSQAEVAAAYELAAMVLNGEAAVLEADASRFRSGTDPHHYRMNFAAAARKQSATIRALATPDQTAALDQMIAEAEALAVEKTAEMVRTWRNTTPMTGEECANAILAAIPEGGDA